MTEGCILLTTDHQMYNKHSVVKASHLSTDAAVKTKEVMMTAVPLYRSRAAQFSKKTLAGMTMRAHTENLHW